MKIFLLFYLFLLCFNSSLFAQKDKETIFNYGISSIIDTRGVNIYTSNYDLKGNLIFYSRGQSTTGISEKRYCFYVTDILVKDSTINYYGQNDSSITTALYYHDKTSRIIKEKRLTNADTTTLTYEYDCSSDSSICFTKVLSNGKLYYTITDSTRDLTKISILSIVDNWSRTSVSTNDEKGNIIVSEFYYGPYILNKTEYEYNPLSQVIKQISTSYLNNDKHSVQSIETTHYFYNDADQLIQKTVYNMDSVLVKTIDFEYYNNGLLKEEIYNTPEGESRNEITYYFFD